jgi:hypothetical protein
MPNIMLDLETMGTRPGSAIVIIAALPFTNRSEWTADESKETLWGRDHFYTRIDLNSCIAEGLTVDPLTQAFWNEQDDTIKHEALVAGPRIPIRQALAEFSEWYTKHSGYTTLWGNGSSFDCGILAEAYKVLGMTPPWKFWHERDLRTVIDIGGMSARDMPQTNLHHALWDCWRQVIGYQRAIRRISGGFQV